jgi:hypothetical protein
MLAVLSAMFHKLLDLMRPIMSGQTWRERKGSKFVRILGVGHKVVIFRYDGLRNSSVRTSMSKKAFRNEFIHFK